MGGPPRISRRVFTLGAAAGVLAGCSSSTPRSRTGSGSGSNAGAAGTRSAAGGHNGTVQQITYGTDASQFAELYRPETRRHDGVIVLIHGGFWRAEYGLSLGRPLARDLAAHGWTCWNLEYRRVGNGGGWPATLDDVAAGIDRLADNALDVDTSTVVAVGHSAGGQLAVWAAGRPRLPAGAVGAAPKVRLSAAVSQAGVLDLRTAAITGVGGTAVPDLLGGAPGDVPERYRLADPIEQVPLPVPVLCVHGRADANVPYAQSTAYVAAATAAHAAAALHEVPGDHFTLIDPATPAWSLVRDALPDLAQGRLP